MARIHGESRRSASPLELLVIMTLTVGAIAGRRVKTVPSVYLHDHAEGLSSKVGVMLRSTNRNIVSHFVDHREASAAGNVQKPVPGGAMGMVAGANATQLAAKGSVLVEKAHYSPVTGPPVDHREVPALSVPIDFKSDLRKLAVPVILCVVFLCCLAAECAFTDQESSSDLHELRAVRGLSADGCHEFTHDPFCLKDFRMDTLRRVLPRLAVAFLIWAVCLYCNNVSQAWLQKYMSGLYVARSPGTLWDLGFQLLPEVRSTALAELGARATPVLVFIRFIAMPGPWSMRWTIATRCLLIWGLIWALRAIMIVSTALPNPDRTCQPHVSFPDNIFLEALVNMPFVFWESELTCQDVLFSGHTAALTLATMTWIRYAPWAPCLPKSTSMLGEHLFQILMVLSMFLGYYVIIASKFHYTADVLVAAISTALIFQAYHSAMRLSFLPESKPSLRRFSLYAFLRWFDEDAADADLMKKQFVMSQQ